MSKVLPFGYQPDADDPRMQDYSMLPGLQKFKDVPKENLEAYAYEQAARTTFMGITMGCMRNIHGRCAHVVSCAHCTRQDEKNPSGIVWFPWKHKILGKRSGFFLCKKCLDLKERKRFNIRELYINCYLCIMAESQRLMAIDPALIVDLRDVDKNK